MGQLQSYNPDLIIYVLRLSTCNGGSITNDNEQVVCSKLIHWGKASMMDNDIIVGRGVILRWVKPASINNFFHSSSVLSFPPTQSAINQRSQPMTASSNKPFPSAWRITSTIITFPFSWDNAFLQFFRIAKHSSSAQSCKTDYMYIPITKKNM